MQLERRMTKMKKLTVIMAMALCFLMVSSTVWADNYLTLKTGLFFPENDDVLDSGYNVQAAFGKSLVDLFPALAAKGAAWKNVSAELGIGYRHADGEEEVSSFGTTVKTHQDLDVIPVTLVAFYTYEIADSGFKIYGGAGPGLYFAFTDTDVTTTSIYTGTTKTSDDDSTQKFGVVLKGGALYSLNPQWELSAALQKDIVSDDVGGLCFNIGVRIHF
jgi:outer membrane protein W